MLHYYVPFIIGSLQWFFLSFGDTQSNPNLDLNWGWKLEVLGSSLGSEGMKIGLGIFY
jgi:hypothetical protein